MSKRSQPFRIVVGVDFSETSMLAIEEALAQSELRPACELHFASVVDSDHAELVPEEQRHRSMVLIADKLRDQLGRVAREALATLYGRDGQATTFGFTHVRVGPIAEELASLATELRADLILVGTHGRRGLRRLVMGSVAEKTIRLSPCPVLVVRPRNFHAMDTVPALEPACPACVKTREATAGRQWWCAVHTSEPDLVHIYSRSERLDQPSSPAPFGSS